jgi:hypothetical protein
VNRRNTVCRNMATPSPLLVFSQDRQDGRLISSIAESKITVPVLGWLEDSVIRSDSRDFEVAESFSTCADIWIVW